VTARAGGASLRSRTRAARRNLAPAARLAADASICRHVRALPAFRSARRVALYFSFDGEPDISSLIRFDQIKEYFAPVIFGNDMHFAAIGPKTRLEPNAYGIAEPVPAELIDPRALDIVLTPLVAFDHDGNRVGVGAGFYDRCFGFLRQRRCWFKPKLAGVAYSLQRVDSIDANAWDVPLWGVITERGFRSFRLT
jgi:5-formyltetrahydrofolate cyclo-ligase